MLIAMWRRVVGGLALAGVCGCGAPEPSALDLQVYRIGLDGSNRTRLSKTPGTHQATFNAARTRVKYATRLAMW